MRARGVNTSGWPAATSSILWPEATDWSRLSDLMTDATPSHSTTALLLDWLFNARRLSHTRVRCFLQ
jgi:hypothetical protein